jgi:predicted DNA-binding protein (UPF0251 family)
VGEVNLTVEELEAIRLKDLEGLEQEECAKQMGVSRATFQRILYSARSKVAEALVCGKAIRISGGSFQVPSIQRMQCLNCGHVLEFPVGQVPDGAEVTCPECGEGPVYFLEFVGPPEWRPPGGCKGGPGRGRRFRGGC